MTLFEHTFTQDMTDRLGPGYSLTLTDNRSTMISIRKKKSATHVRMARYFALGDREVTDSLFAYLSGAVKSLPKNVRAFAESQPTPKEAAKKAKVKARTKGAHYDLDKIAKEINRRYFDGALKATITWGRGGAIAKKRRSKSRHIQLGSFSHDLDLIRINPVLDSETVPPEYLELVIYHEMLHKKFDTGRDEQKIRERRSIHPKTFREAEREYEGYEVAMAWERKNLDRLFAMRNKKATAKAR